MDSENWIILNRSINKNNFVWHFLSIVIICACFGRIPVFFILMISEKSCLPGWYVLAEVQIQSPQVAPQYSSFDALAKPQADCWPAFFHHWEYN